MVEPKITRKADRAAAKQQYAKAHLYATNSLIRWHRMMAQAELDRLTDWCWVKSPHRDGGYINGW